MVVAAITAMTVARGNSMGAASRVMRGQPAASTCGTGFFHAHRSRAPTALDGNHRVMCPAFIPSSLAALGTIEYNPHQKVVGKLLEAVRFARGDE